jgi:hypothetical protein
MRRLSIRLPDPAHERLQEHARQSGLPVARTATDLLCTTLEADNPPTGRPAARSERHPAIEHSPSAAQAGTPPPPWLPSDSDPHWTENTKAAIDALCRRYPDALAKLEHDWHERPERVEVLAALATWRASIDATAEDPREELSFHNALQQLTRTLDRSGGLNSAR